MNSEKALEIRCVRYKNIIQKYVPDWTRIVSKEYNAGHISNNDYSFLIDCYDLPKAVEKPPFEIPSKNRWLAERMNDVCCAIQKHLVEKHEIPKDLMEEMIWLTNIIREVDRNENHI